MKRPVSVEEGRQLLSYAKAVVEEPELLSRVGLSPVAPLDKEQRERLRRTGSPYLRRLAEKARLSQDAIAGQRRLPLS